MQENVFSRMAEQAASIGDPVLTGAGRNQPARLQMDVVHGTAAPTVPTPAHKS